MIPEEPDTAVDIHREDDGSIEPVFGGGVSAADRPRASPASRPTPRWRASARTGTASATTAKARTSRTRPMSTR